MVKYIIAFFLLSGCTFKSLLVSNLDWVITQRVDQEIFLYGEQEDAFQKDIKVFLNEQKSLIHDFQIKLSNTDIKKDDIEEKVQQARAYYIALATKLAPLLSQYIMTLDETQIKKMRTSFIEKNKEIEEEIATFNVGKIHDRYERYLGPLTNKQKSLIKQNQNIHIALKRERLGRRQKVQSELMSALQMNPRSKNKIENILKDYAKQELTRSQVSNIALIKEVLRIATDHQLKQLSEKKEEILEWSNLVIAHQY